MNTSFEYGKPAQNGHFSFHHRAAPKVSTFDYEKHYSSHPFSRFVCLCFSSSRSSVSFAHPDGRIQCMLDRAFYAGRKAFEHKPAAVIVSARRAGTTASLDVLSKYPLIAEMPLVASSYWPMVHGSTPAQVLEDEEGIQTVRNLAHNMAWLLKCIELGKQNGVPVPKNETGAKTNFIR